MQRRLIRYQHEMKKKIIQRKPWTMDEETVMIYFEFKMRLGEFSEGTKNQLSAPTPIFYLHLFQYKVIKAQKIIIVTASFYGFFLKKNDLFECDSHHSYIFFVVVYFNTFFHVVQ